MKNPLEDLYQLISRGTIHKDVEHQGKIYRFLSLFDEDYTWRDQFTNMSGPAAYNSSQRAPTLAIATVAIDGIPVEQIEDLTKPPKDLAQAIQDLIRENSKYIVAYNLYQIYTKLPREYVIELYAKFLEEVETAARMVKAEDIKNS
jgi:hypothetical protein